MRTLIQYVRGSFKADIQLEKQDQRPWNGPCLEIYEKLLPIQENPIFILVRFFPLQERSFAVNTADSRIKQYILTYFLALVGKILCVVTFVKMHEIVFVLFLIIKELGIV